MCQVHIVPSGKWTSLSNSKLQMDFFGMIWALRPLSDSESIKFGKSNSKHFKTSVDALSGYSCTYVIKTNTVNRKILETTNINRSFIAEKK
jgi:hypothetical protein